MRRDSIETSHNQGWTYRPRFIKLHSFSGRALPTPFCRVSCRPRLQVKASVKGSSSPMLANCFTAGKPTSNCPPTLKIGINAHSAQDWSNHTRDVLPLRRARSCRVVKQSFVLLNPKYLNETNGKTVCRHLNHCFFIELEPGFEPSDAFLISTSEPYSTL